MGYINRGRKEERRGKEGRGRKDGIWSCLMHQRQLFAARCIDSISKGKVKQGFYIGFANENLLVENNLMDLTTSIFKISIFP